MPLHGPGLTGAPGPDTDPSGRAVPEPIPPFSIPSSVAARSTGNGVGQETNGGGRHAAGRRDAPTTGDDDERDRLLDAPPPSGPPVVTDPSPDAVRPPGGPPARRDRSRRARRRAAALRVRRVKRVVRRVNAWSVLKVSLLFNLCLYVVVMVAGVLLWSAGRATGAIESVEGFVESLFSYETFRFEADMIFRAGVLGGGVVALFLTGLSVLGVLLFNLISDLVGGIRVTVLEEDAPRPPEPRSRRAPAAPDQRSVRAGGRSR